MDNWTQTIELTYRAFVRESRAIEDTFEEVLSNLREYLPEAEIAVEQEEGMMFPIKFEKVNEAKEKGFMVVEHAQLMGNSLITREWTLSIPMGKGGDARACVEGIVSQVGNVFTNVRVIDKLFTDIPPQ